MLVYLKHVQLAPSSATVFFIFYSTAPWIHCELSLHWCQQVTQCKHDLKDKEHVLETHPHVIQKYTKKDDTKKKQNKKWTLTEEKNNKQPTEYHIITVRRDDTGFQVTSTHIRIFTSVSSLILCYCRNHLLNWTGTIFKDSSDTRQKPFVLKSIWRPHKGYAHISSFKFTSKTGEITGLSHYFIFYLLFVQMSY